ncbi:MAG: GTPase ObgE [Candidatus Omnitrophica bacterium]|nr:GTPase ObgE [Candidatus Omnitrophota bacterium]
MFIDEVRIFVKAGDGGDGCDSFYRDRFNRWGRPDGGYGGKGGDIVFAADENVQTLLDFQYRQHFKAQRGGHGSSNHKKGKSGEDLHIKVPPGTLIKDADNDLLLRELLRPGDSVIIARGGAGGKGNSKNYPADLGVKGEEKILFLELKLIADAGIIGYPNAGKSTLVSKISSAKPKIANYPFTTKEPVLGVVRLYDSASFVIAEIPGLIEGAHRGKGLGDKFLRHIERTKVLVHLIDASACDGRSPGEDYVKLNKELELYSKALAKKTQFIVLNKSDLPTARENIKIFKKNFPRKKIFTVSALNGEGIKELLSAIHKKLKGKSQ